MCSLTVDLNLGARHHGMSYGALICERFRYSLLHHTCHVTSSYMLCHIIIHTMSHHHTCHVTSSYILCHIIIQCSVSRLYIVLQLQRAVQNLRMYACVCVCARACMCAFVCVCVNLAMCMRRLDLSREEAVQYMQGIIQVFFFFNGVDVFFNGVEAFFHSIHETEALQLTPNTKIDAKRLCSTCNDDVT